MSEPNNQGEDKAKEAGTEETDPEVVVIRSVCIVGPLSQVDKILGMMPLGTTNEGDVAISMSPMYGPIPVVKEGLVAQSPHFIDMVEALNKSLEDELKSEPKFFVAIPTRFTHHDRLSVKITSDSYDDLDEIRNVDPKYPNAVLVSTTNDPEVPSIIIGTWNDVSRNWERVLNPVPVHIIPAGDSEATKMPSA
ncbi:hypothetical protein LCGC14_1644730 [marine sediment metagenome]|uniref:Uncharacterized protein n=1 Tax=marine sediment metagenome TaxID=412755 RepID=A0A0F9IL68_9ZZZZ